MCIWIATTPGGLRLALEAIEPSDKLVELERRIAGERLRAHLLRDAPLDFIASVVTEGEGSDPPPAARAVFGGAFEVLGIVVPPRNA